MDADMIAESPATDLLRFIPKMPAPILPQVISVGQLLESVSSYAQFINIRIKKNRTYHTSSQMSRHYMWPVKLLVHQSQPHLCLTAQWPVNVKHWEWGLERSYQVGSAMAMNPSLRNRQSLGRWANKQTDRQTFFHYLKVKINLHSWFTNICRWTRRSQSREVMFRQNHGWLWGCLRRVPLIISWKRPDANLLNTGFFSWSLLLYELINVCFMLFLAGIRIGLVFLSSCYS